MRSDGFRLGIGILLGVLQVEVAMPRGRASAGDSAAMPISAEQLDFFEKKIRPLLVDRCLDCHSEDASGGLQLDSAAAIRRGGASGPALVPGNPAESRIIHAVRGEKGVQAMPPDDPLSEGAIDDLVKWIETGAADPRTSGGAASPQDKLFEQARTHWAFQPIAEPRPPAVKAPDLVRTPIDAFVQAALEANGWSMSPRADARTLLRRAALDLTGVPPTAAEVDAVTGEPASAVFDAAIERLLASPRYGERWARHWLDVARYADSMGTGGGGGDTPYTFAWTYRDWCVQAFNDDMPFDRFVTAQLAADLNEVTPDDNRQLAALGFMTVGQRRDARVDDDVIDDRIDVITRGLLGLSVSCARCHDHKLEPIPTRDYYGLYGVLKSCAEPAVYPVMKPQPQNPDSEAYAAENRKAREHFIRMTAFEAERGVVFERGRLGDYLLAVHDGKSKWVYDDNRLVQKEILTPRGLSSGIYTDMIRARKTWLEAHPAVFRPWLELATLPVEEFTARAPPLIAAYAANADGSIAKMIAAAFASEKPRTLADVAALYNKQAQYLDLAWGERFRGALDKLCVLRPDEEDMALIDLENRAIQRIHEADGDALRPGTPLASDNAAVLVRVMTAEESPFVFRDSRKTTLFRSRNVAEGLRRNATAAVTGLATHPGAPIRLMAIEDGKPFNARIFIRGNPQAPGEAAPRGYLSVLRSPDATPFPEDSSGRKEFAELVVSPRNPLTARVIVNRVWGWHFGRGLVTTASDFGLQGEPPSHPELLDWLASRFIADGWSLKKLHRLIMQSHVYQQAAAVGAGEAATGSCRALDPDNRFLGRFPSRPLEFEAVRDAMLAVGGGLEESPGGRPFIIDDAAARRRTVYAHIDRKRVTPVMRAFNVPDSCFTSAGRSRTALPAQALWLFNSPFAIESAKRLAAQSQKRSSGPGSAPADVVRDLWLAVFQREPSPTECADAAAFIASCPKDDIVEPQADDWSYGFADFDMAAGTVSRFTRLNDFRGTTVRGRKMADFDGSSMEITPDGGKAAPGKAAVRRWTSPETGTVKIEAELVHVVLPSQSADTTAESAPEAIHAESHDLPIVCRIVHSRHGQLGEWKANSDGVITKVETVACEVGDTIDFIALTDLDPARNGFIWSPTIIMSDREMPMLPGMPMRWDARHDFLDPKAMPKPLGPWEQLAQILLMTGEFTMLP
jgi:hypothetical protein